MDVAVELVQSYIRLNGYLTASEYPLVEPRGSEHGRVITDLDVLAVRFERARESGTGAQGRRVLGPVADRPDPALGCPNRGTDMIVAEVKQGRAFANPAIRDPRVLAATLARFGCCHPEESHDLVRRLLRRGTASSSIGHSVRMVLFAERGERAPHGWHWVRLDQVVQFIDGYLRSRHEEFAGVDLKDAALSWLALLQKCGFRLVPEDVR